MMLLLPLQMEAACAALLAQVVSIRDLVLKL
jgi:hypothetical protein